MPAPDPSTNRESHAADTAGATLLLLTVPLVADLEVRDAKAIRRLAAALNELPEVSLDGACSGGRVEGSFRDGEQVCAVSIGDKTERRAVTPALVDAWADISPWLPRGMKDPIAPNFWEGGTPTDKGRLAFGKAPFSRRAGNRSIIIDAYERKSVFPPVPSEAYVYQVAGDDPPRPGELERALSLSETGQGQGNEYNWRVTGLHYYPLAAGFQWSPNPLYRLRTNRQAETLSTPEDARTRARAWLQQRGLLAADLGEPEVARENAGGWVVTFARYLGQMRVYAFWPVRLHLDNTGEVRHVFGVHRRTVAMSLQPLRTLERAWYVPAVEGS